MATLLLLLALLAADPEEPICGDINHDGKVNVADPVAFLNDFVRMGPRRAEDCNGDGRADLSDPIYLVRYLFQHGPEPVCEEAP